MFFSKKGQKIRATLNITKFHGSRSHESLYKADQMSALLCNPKNASGSQQKRKRTKKWSPGRLAKSRISAYYPSQGVIETLIRHGNFSYGDTEGGMPPTFESSLYHGKSCNLLLLNFIFTSSSANVAPHVFTN